MARPRELVRRTGLITLPYSFISDSLKDFLFSVWRLRGEILNTWTFSIPRGGLFWDSFFKSYRRQLLVKLGGAQLKITLYKLNFAITFKFLISMPRKCQCRAEICEAIWPRPWRGTALHLQGGGGGTVQELLQNVQSSSLSWSWTLLSLFIVFWGDDSSWKFDHICSYALMFWIYRLKLIVYLNATFVYTRYQSRNIHIRPCCLCLNGWFTKIRLWQVWVHCRLYLNIPCITWTGDNFYFWDAFYQLLCRGKQGIFGGLAIRRRVALE